MNKSVIIVAVLGFAALIIATQAFFIVDQTQQAIVLQLGQPRGEARGPGLHIKMPFIQDVRMFDRRILPVDPAPQQAVISSSMITKIQRAEEAKKNEAQEAAGELTDGPVIENVSGEPIIVDTFARYKIIDPLKFMKTLRTVNDANSRIETILNDTTRGVLGQTTLKELLSQERNTVMKEILDRVNIKVKQDQLGIEIVDVRIVRADLTPELLTSTVRRMVSELQERATETRAKGTERAKEIRSAADKQRTILIAEAHRDSEMKKGEGDKEAIKIYADAFNKDAEFYSFMRSMEAYKNTLANPETRLILSPGSDFFRFFGAVDGGGPQ